MKWKDPKNDPPPINTMVIAYSEKKGVHVDFVTTAGMFTKSSKITDWMPYPNKPKRNKK